MIDNGGKELKMFGGFWLTSGGIWEK